jgi:hypothetical protein
MVEELVAEGLSPAEIVDLMVAQYGLSPGQAELAVQVALGGPGDYIVEELEELVPDGTAADVRSQIDELVATRAGYDPNQPRDPGGRDGGQWVKTVSTDNPQQAAILKQSATARKVRERYPPGKRVGSVGGAEGKIAELGTVVRHVPGANAQGGYLVVKWDNGTEGRISPIAITPVPPTPRINSSGVNSEIPYARIEPTVFEEMHTGKHYLVFEFASDGGVGNPREYVWGRGTLIKKDGTLGTAGKNTIRPVDGIPPYILDELERVAAASR